MTDASTFSSDVPRMGWFSKKPQDTPEKKAVGTMTEFVDCLFDSDEDAINASADARLAFSAFVVGAVTAYRAEARPLHAPGARGCDRAVHGDGDGLGARAEMAHFGIEATSKGSPWNYAAHAGMDEFLGWEQRPEGYLPAYLQPALAKAPRAR